MERKYDIWMIFTAVSITVQYSALRQIGIDSISFLIIRLSFFIYPPILLMPEMNKDPAVIFIVFFYTVIHTLDLRAFQKAQHVLLQLAAPLTGDDLD